MSAAMELLDLFEKHLSGKVVITRRWIKMHRQLLEKYAHVGCEPCSYCAMPFNDTKRCGCGANR